jgi:hypothetical protein
VAKPTSVNDGEESSCPTKVACPQDTENKQVAEILNVSQQGKWVGKRSLAE